MPERTLTASRAIRQLEVPKDAKVPSNWTKMSGTQKLSRYYTPETTRMIADLKEARERKQMVINDFQYKVRPSSPSSAENLVLSWFPRSSTASSTSTTRRGWPSSRPLLSSTVS